MGKRLTTLAAVAIAASLLLVASAAAAMIGVYRNSMDTTALRGQIVKLSGESCGRGELDGALRITVGKATSECSYRTPVLGRGLEISATERLLGSTPKALKRKAFLGLQLRSGDGARYQLAVFPLQRKVQLRKVLSDGTTEYLDIAKSVPEVRGVGQANQLRLSAINVTKGPDRGLCRLRAYVGGSLVAEAVDEGAGDLTGRASGISVGADGNAKGTMASVDDVVVRIPSPF
ncbi:MAG TPA: hypothetical protein VF259_05120 [Solirubrobacterales bacterium]